jgi:hypothetical protein
MPLAADWVVPEAPRFWIGIGIERWFIDETTSRQETATTHFVPVGFDGHKTGQVWYVNTNSLSSTLKIRQL